MDKGDRKEEILRILGLVESGELSAGEADELLSAMDVEYGPPGTDVPAASAHVSRSPREDTGTAGQRRDREREIHVDFDDRASRSQLSAELRKLRREARRIAHEARRVAKHDLREAMREARHGIEHAVKLGLQESSRALEEVRAELQTVFGEGKGHAAGHPRWLANLAGLDLQRDRVKHTATSSLAADLEGAERVSIKNVNGDVVVDSWDRDRVEVKAEKTAWGMDREVAQDRAESLPVDIQRRNGEILVDARGPVPSGVGLLNLQRMHTDLIVSVPARVPLEVTTRAGDVTVRGHAAELSVVTTSGDIRLLGSGEKVKSESVSGDTVLSTDAAVEAELATLSGDLSAGFRPVPGGQYRFRSSSGDIHVRLTPRAALRCEVETASGDLDVRPPLNVVSRQRRRVVAELAALPGEGQEPAFLAAATLSGDVRISGSE